VLGVREDDLDLIRPRTETNDHQLLSAGVCPAPGRVIDHDMDVSDTRRNFECLGPKHRHDPKVHRMILNETLPSRSGPGSGGSTMVRAGGCGAVRGTTPGGQHVGGCTRRLSEHDQKFGSRLMYDQNSLTSQEGKVSRSQKRELLDDGIVKDCAALGRRSTPVKYLVR
jgi:hypothetical protein